MNHKITAKGRGVPEEQLADPVLRRPERRPRCVSFEECGAIYRGFSGLASDLNVSTLGDDVVWISGLVSMDDFCSVGIYLYPRAHSRFHKRLRLQGSDHRLAGTRPHPSSVRHHSDERPRPSPSTADRKDWRRSVPSGCVLAGVPESVRPQE